MTDGPGNRYEDLPRHLAAASALFRDPGGRVLLVKPTYRPEWLLPGGGLDPGEYPWEAARREVKEELGLSLADGRLLAVDWTGPLPDGRPALVAFVFDGGVLTPERAESEIHLPADELSDWRFIGRDDWSGFTTPGIAVRLDACLDALDRQSTVYLQDGRPHVQTGEPCGS